MIEVHPLQTCYPAVLISFTEGHVAGPSNLKLKPLLISSRRTRGKGENTTVNGMPERPLSWALNRSFLFYLHFIIMQINYENVINLSFSSLICHSWRSARERSVPWHWWWVVISQFFQKQPLLCIISCTHCLVLGPDVLFFLLQLVRTPGSTQLGREEALANLLSILLYFRCEGLSFVILYKSLLSDDRFS